MLEKSCGGSTLRQRGIAHRGELPLRLRLFAFRVQLEHRRLEDALVRVVARVGPGAVAQGATVSP